MVPKANEVISRIKNETILAYSSVKAVSLKIVIVYVQSATSISLKSTHQKKKLGERTKTKYTGSAVIRVGSGYTLYAQA